MFLHGLRVRNNLRNCNLLGRITWKDQSNVVAKTDDDIDQEEDWSASVKSNFSFTVYDVVPSDLTTVLQYVALNPLRENIWALNLSPFVETSMTLFHFSTPYLQGYIFFTTFCLNFDLVSTQTGKRRPLFDITVLFNTWDTIKVGQ